jgi:hypothetical protein
LATVLCAAAAACTASEHSPPAAASLSHGTSQRGTHNASSAVSAPISEGSVPLNWLLCIYLRAAAAACALSTVLPPPSVHGTSGTGTHQYVSIRSAPSSEGSVPENWLWAMFLRAAATACTLSTVLQPPPSVHGTSQRSTHQYASFVSAPSSEGSVPLIKLKFEFLRRRRRQKRSQHSPSAAASLSPWHLTEGHSQ